MEPGHLPTPRQRTLNLALIVGSAILVIADIVLIAIDWRGLGYWFSLLAMLMLLASQISQRVRWQGAGQR